MVPSLVILSIKESAPYDIKSPDIVDYPAPFYIDIISISFIWLYSELIGMFDDNI